MELHAQASFGRRARGPRVFAVLCAVLAGCMALAGCASPVHATGLSTSSGATSSRSTAREVSLRSLPRTSASAGSTSRLHLSTAAPSTSPVPRHVAAAGRSPSACQPAQLRFGYGAGGEGTGNDFGTIAIVDASPTGCVLTGTITVTPIAARGRPPSSKIAAPQSVRASNIPLSAHGVVPHFTRPAPAGQTWAGILLGGVENMINIGGGPCSKADTVTPAGWRISGATGTAFVRNLDSTVLPRGSYPSLFACFFDGRAQFLIDSVAGLRTP